METILKPAGADISELQYVTNICTNFQRNHSKTVGGIRYTKLLEFDMRPAKLQYVTNVCTNFENKCSKTVGEVRDTKLLVSCSKTDTQTHGRTEIRTETPSH